MKQHEIHPEQIGPCVPWPHIGEADTRTGAFNPARQDRGPADHQADGQEKKEQAS